MSKILEILKIKNIGKEDEFIKLYFNDLGKIWGLSKPSQKLFGELIQYIEYNPQSTIHNLISLNSDKKDFISKKLDWKKSSSYAQFSHCFKELIEYEVLFKLGKETYLLNPSIASKANWADVKLIRNIKMEITYDRAHKTLITFVESLSDRSKEIIKVDLENS
jgi:hypothetical protein